MGFFWPYLPQSAPASRKRNIIGPLTTCLKKSILPAQSAVFVSACNAGIETGFSPTVSFARAMSLDKVGHFTIQPNQQRAMHFESVEAVAGRTGHQRLDHGSDRQ